MERATYSLRNIPFVTVARRYLEAISTHRWDEAQGCLAEDVVRVGPYGDTYSGREHYLGWLRKLMVGLKGYRMDIGRIVSSSDGRTLTAELAETVEMDGRQVVTPECLVFDLDQAGLISTIRIYIQQQGTN